MKKRLKFLLIIPFLQLVFIRCATKCDEFNNEITEWMPYKISDSIIISNNENQEKLLVTQSIIYHTDKIGYGMKCICENNFYLTLSSDSFHIDVYFYNSQQEEQSEITINDEWLAFSEILDSMEIDNKNYEEVIIYKNNSSNSSNKIDKILISKSVGIVAILTNNCIWTLTDTLKNKVKTSEIELINNNC